MASLLVVASPASAAARALLEAAERGGVRAETAEGLQAGDAPDAVAVDVGLESPVTQARGARALWPDSSLAFLVPDARAAAAFETAVRLTPLLGSFRWLRADDPGLAAAVRRLVDAGRQRRRFRTILATTREQLATAQQPSSEQHRPKVLSELYLASILQHIDDAVIAVDLAGLVTAWNVGAQRLFGLSEAEAVGKALKTLTGIEAPASPRPAQDIVLGSETGGRRLDLRVAPVVDAGARLVGYSLIARDVTERARLIEELQAARAELEDRVARRTAELAASNAELESFAYSVAHDLRSPLRSIHGFTTLTLRRFGGLLPDEGRAYLERASAAALRLSELVDGLLTLSRLARRPLDRRPVDLTKTAERLFHETEAERAGRRVEFAAEPGLVERADEQLVEAILRNLIGNAVKFSAGKDPARIELGRSPDGSFCLRDNGIGFDPDYAGKLFEPFQRLHANQGFAGTGIGLAIVQRAVARHGGTVRAEGRPGEGAAFFFTLQPRSR